MNDRMSDPSEVGFLLYLVFHSIGTVSFSLYNPASIIHSISFFMCVVERKICVDAR